MNIGYLLMEKIDDNPARPRPSARPLSADKARQYLVAARGYWRDVRGFEETEVVKDQAYHYDSGSGQLGVDLFIQPINASEKDQNS